MFNQHNTACIYLRYYSILLHFCSDIPAGEAILQVIFLLYANENLYLLYYALLSTGQLHDQQPPGPC